MQLAIDFRNEGIEYFTLRESRPLQGMLLPSPPPTAAIVRVDCACEIQKQKLFARRKGVRFTDIFRAVDHLLRGSFKCGNCEGYYYVRVEGKLAVATSSYVRMLKVFRH